MGLYKTYERSQLLTETGARCPFPWAKNEDGSIPTFIVARSHNSNQLFTKAVADVYTPEYNKLRAEDKLSEEELVAANLQVLIQGNIMAWENVHDRDGTPLGFSRENVTRVLTDLPELVDQIRAFSSDFANFSKAAEEAAVKN